MNLRSVPRHKLHSEINRRDRAVRTLKKRRARVASRLNAVDKELAAMGGGAGARGKAGPRPARGGLNLKAALGKVLASGAKTVTDAAAGLAKVGYQSFSPNLRTMVNAALLDKKVFKRVERGVYAVK